MNIRKAKLKDVPHIIKFAFDLHKQHEMYDPYYELVEASELIIKNYYRKLILNPNCCFLVVEIKNKILGYAYGTKGERAPYYKELNFGYFNEIFISNDLRNKGLATMLINEVFLWFKHKNLKYSEIEVDSRNKIANEVWGGQGYVNFIKKKYKIIEL